MRIPVIKANGTHYEVGRQIGTAARASIQQIWVQTRTLYRARWPGLLAASSPFLQAAETELPGVIEELRGAAAGAGVPFAELFLMSIEELLNEEVRGEWDSRPPGRDRSKGCSDLAAASPATADGHVWLAHNNDLGPSAVEHLYVTQIAATGEPEIMAVTVGGIFISIGFNAAGIGLTGNQLYANDSRTGVPRLLIVRDILAQSNFDSAIGAAMRSSRASSYNNLVSSVDGRIASVEGSATDCAVLAAERGVTVHTNHYTSPAMQRYEQRDYNTAPSAARCTRAAQYAAKYHGRIDRTVCSQFLADHVFAPWSICRHAGDSVTVFGAIIDLTERRMWLARGNPCVNEYEEHML